MAETAPMTPTTPPTAPTPKLTETERLRQAKAKIDARLAEIARNEAKRKNTADAEAAKVLGQLAKEAGLVADLVAKATDKQRAKLSAAGWL